MAKQNVTVELFHSGQWNNVTTDVRVRDGITITQGRQDESGTVGPSTAALTFDGAGFNPRNQSSPLFGLIGRNTPIRVTMDGTDRRFWGEVSAWQPRRSLDENDRWVNVAAAGILRRLGQGSTPLKSALRAYNLSGTDFDFGDAAGYWPMEDGPDSQGLVNLAPGGQPLTLVAGRQQLAADDTLAGSAPLPLALHDSTQAQQLVFRAQVPLTGGEFTFAWWDRARFVSGTGGFAASTLTIRVENSADIDFWRFGITRDQDGDLDTFRAFAATDAAPSTPVAGTLPFPQETHNPDWRFIRCRVNDSVLILNIDGDDKVFEAHSVELGNVTRIELQLGITGDQTAIPMSAGHLIGFSVFEPFSDAVFAAGAGHAGELAGVRIPRLCAQEGVALQTVGDLAGTQPLGPQRPGRLVDLLREAATTDGGILAESRTALGLLFRTGRDLYNQTAAIELDYAQDEVAPPLDPAADDLGVRNDVTVTRDGGGSRRVEETTGPLSTADPPDGVGRVEGEVTLSLLSDQQALSQAGWRLHLGTVEDLRWPKVSIDLDAAPTLAAAVAATGLGDRLDVLNPPATLTADDIAALVQGWTETIGSHRRRITYNASPAEPFRVFVLGHDILGRLDTSGSALDQPATASDTALSVATTAFAAVPWITTAGQPGEFPFNALLGGAEIVRVTGIADTATPGIQTFTVVRSINGVVRSWLVGAPVQLSRSAVGL